MTEQEVIDVLKSGQRIRLVPHTFARTGSKRDPRNLYVGSRLIKDDFILLLGTMVRSGLLEEHEDRVCGILEYTLPGVKCVWQ